MHDMVRVTMKRRGNYFLSLEVPGLAEKRPSLVYGDYVFAQLATDDADDRHSYQVYLLTSMLVMLQTKSFMLLNTPKRSS